MVLLLRTKIDSTQLMILRAFAVAYGHHIVDAHTSSHSVANVQLHHIIAQHRKCSVDILVLLLLPLVLLLTLAPTSSPSASTSVLLLPLFLPPFFNVSFPSSFPLPPHPTPSAPSPPHPHPFLHPLSPCGNPVREASLAAPSLRPTGSPVSSVLWRRAGG